MQMEMLKICKIYARKYKFLRKATREHLNMPGIDAIGCSHGAVAGWHPNAMNAAKDGKADACIKCRRNKRSDLNKMRKQSDGTK